MDHEVITPMNDDDGDEKAHKYKQHNQFLKKYYYTTTEYNYLIYIIDISHAQPQHHWQFSSVL